MEKRTWQRDFLAQYLAVSYWLLEARVESLREALSAIFKTRTHEDDLHHVMRAKQILAAWKDDYEIEQLLDLIVKQQDLFDSDKTLEALLSAFGYQLGTWAVMAYCTAHPNAQEILLPTEQAIKKRIDVLATRSLGTSSDVDVSADFREGVILSTMLPTHMTYLRVSSTEEEQQHYAASTEQFKSWILLGANRGYTAAVEMLMPSMS